MLNITDSETVAKIESYCRTWRMWIENADEIITGADILSAESTQQSTSLSDDIELGAICSASWSVKISANKSKSYLGNEYDVSLYLINPTLAGGTTYGALQKYTYGQLARLTSQQIASLGDMIGDKIPMAKMTCIKSKNSGNSVELTLADKLYFADKVYTHNPHMRFPTSGRSIEYDICNQLGLTNGINYSDVKALNDNTNKGLCTNTNLRLYTASFDIMVDSIPEGTTMRQMLSYIASAQGQFGYVDRNGKYTRRWYGAPVKTIDNNTIDVPTLSESVNVIAGLSCKVSDSLTLTQGDVTGQSGRVISFENPYMTSSLFESLWFRLSGFAWSTAELFNRLGDPRFDVGDVLTYIDNNGEVANIPITNLGFNYDGGLSADITAVGMSAQEQTLEGG